MFDKRELVADGKSTERRRLNTMLKDSDQYSELLRQKADEDRRRGGVFYFTFILLVALIGIGLVWVSH